MSEGSSSDAQIAAKGRLLPRWRKGKRYTSWRQEGDLLLYLYLDAPDRDEDLSVRQREAQAMVILDYGSRGQIIGAEVLIGVPDA